MIGVFRDFPRIAFLIFFLNFLKFLGTTRTILWTTLQTFAPWHWAFCMFAIRVLILDEFRRMRWSRPALGEGPRTPFPPRSDLRFFDVFPAGWGSVSGPAEAGAAPPRRSTAEMDTPAARHAESDVLDALPYR
ncbi:hypothetical protein [Sphaerimonospora mesophila]|uniref:hypothetical protein n=1 Tax=Sphaerimonospora mesophila TaxID=37483 RepID=UPI0006E284F3